METTQQARPRQNPFSAALCLTLLASSSTLFTPNAAQSADLPSGKSAPVAYVRICDAYGSGFFTLPGSDTCIRIGGYVRAEYQYTPAQRMFNIATGALSQAAAGQDVSGFETRGVLRLDGRAPTEYGTVRTYIQLRGATSSGIRRQSVPGNFGLTYPGGNVDNNAITVERAYVEWAGFKFGNISSEWNNWPSGTVVGFIGDLTAGWSNGVKALSYTRSLGGGFTGIVSIESRETAAHDQNTLVGVTANPATPPGLLAPTTTVSTFVQTPLTANNLVGVLRYEQSWGSAQIAGVVGYNSVSTPYTIFSGNGAAAGTSLANPALGVKTFPGWAISPTIGIKLPMIAAGDEIWFNAAYGVGMLGYVTGDSWNTLTGDSPNRRVIGGIQINPSNLMVTSVTPAGVPLTFEQTRSWMVMGLFTHFWAPQFRSHFQAGYAQATSPTAFNPVGGLNTQLGKSTVWEVKSNFIWSPAKDFDIGVEAAYGRMTATIQNPTVAFVAAGSPGLNGGNWTTKFRVQRGF